VTASKAASAVSVITASGTRPSDPPPVAATPRSRTPHRVGPETAAVRPAFTSIARSNHFRYYAGAIRAQEGSLSQIDADTVAYHFHEPLGVVGQIIPWNFPILMATWKLAPALAAGNCVVLKPAEQTPWSILNVIELIGDLLPAGVLNVVNGFGVEAGKPLASSGRIAKIAFTGETTTGRLIMQYASQNLIPVTLELGRQEPEHLLLRRRRGE
jgi:acyl-CoA reductase-like NAD-dependent aldehyde dehydrogenase